MENSELEDMGIGQMLSQAATKQPPDGALTDSFFSSLNKNTSILSLKLDEILCKSGKNFGGMSMDEFLSNLLSAQEIQNQIHSQNNDLKNEPQNLPFMAANTNSRPTLSRQPSFSIPIPLCRKTVDEVWSEIHREKAELHRQKVVNDVQRNPSNSQRALGEMTLADFLVKAGVVQQSSSSSMKQKLPCSPKQSNCNTIFASNISMVDLGGFRMGEKLGLSMPYHLQNAARNMSGNFLSTYQMHTQSVGGESSDNSSIQKCQSLTDWAEHSSNKRIIDGPLEVVVQRRQRRMIKNRESAARSRARKQAYTVELELELNQLKEENVKLKQVVVECERKRNQEMMQRKQFENRQKPTERLRTMRRIGSMAW